MLISLLHKELNLGWIFDNAEHTASSIFSENDNLILHNQQWWEYHFSEIYKNDWGHFRAISETVEFLS